MVSTTPIVLVQQPLDKSLRLRLALSDRDLNAYLASLALALPTREQRGEMAAVTYWRENEENTVTAGDVFRLLCRLEYVDPNISIDDSNATTLNPILTAQRAIWERLVKLEQGLMPRPATIPLPDDIRKANWYRLWQGEVQRWLDPTFALLGRFEGFDVSGIRHMLPRRVKKTLERQTTSELLDTPFLLGYTLHENADRFSRDGQSTHMLAIMLATAVRKARHDIEKPGHEASQRQREHLAFWHHVLVGFMYGATHSERNTLAIEVAEDLDDRDLLHDMLTGAVPPDCTTWKHWTQGDGAELNSRIVNTTGPQLWSIFETQLEAV